MMSELSRFGATCTPVGGGAPGLAVPANQRRKAGLAHGEEKSKPSMAEQTHLHALPLWADIMTST
jgi:hypothetical protein